MAGGRIAAGVGVGTGVGTAVAVGCGVGLPKIPSPGPWLEPPTDTRSPCPALAAVVEDCGVAPRSGMKKRTSAARRIEPGRTILHRLRRTSNEPWPISLLGPWFGLLAWFSQLVDCRTYPTSTVRAGHAGYYSHLVGQPRNRIWKHPRSRPLVCCWSQLRARADGNVNAEEGAPILQSVLDLEIPIDPAGQARRQTLEKSSEPEGSAQSHSGRQRDQGREHQGHDTAATAGAPAWKIQFHCLHIEGGSSSSRPLYPERGRNSSTRTSLFNLTVEDVERAGIETGAGPECEVCPDGSALRLSRRPSHGRIRPDRSRALPGCPAARRAQD